MRILYHHRTSAQDGSAVHIEGLVHALRMQGHEVVVVAPPLAVRPASSAPDGWVARLRKAMPRFVHELIELLYNVPEAVRLARAVREHKPDVLYERSNLFTISGAILAPRYGLPRIVEVNAPYFLERSRHGGIVLKNIARWTEDFAWRRADAVIPVTQVLARIVEESGVEHDRIRVMSNGIDLQLMAPGGAARSARDRLGWSDRVVLGFTGFVREWNGLEPVVDLLAAPGHEQLALLVVGDGPARRGIEERAEQLGVGHRVRFTGRVDRAKVPYWVSSFDIALQPAANPYASPLKLFEYMALGCAIVAPDQANIREVLRHEHNALLFPPGDVRAMAERIDRLKNDASMRRRLAASAQETILTRGLTWSANAHEVVEIAANARRGRVAQGATAAGSFSR